MNSALMARLSHAKRNTKKGREMAARTKKLNTKNKKSAC